MSCSTHHKCSLSSTLQLPTVKTHKSSFSKHHLDHGQVLLTQPRHSKRKHKHVLQVRIKCIRVQSNSIKHFTFACKHHVQIVRPVNNLSHITTIQHFTSHYQLCHTYTIRLQQQVLWASLDRHRWITKNGLAHT